MFGLDEGRPKHGGDSAIYCNRTQSQYEKIYTPWFPSASLPPERGFGMRGSPVHFQQLQHPLRHRAREPLFRSWNSAMDGLGLCMSDAVRFENRLEQHIYLTRLNRFSYQNRLSYYLAWPNTFAQSWEAWSFPGQPCSQAILTNFALISDLRAGRAPVGFTRSNKLSHIYRTWNQGSFTDGSNVVRKQLSLCKCRPKLSKLSVRFLIWHALSTVAPWGRNRNLGLSYKQSTHSVGDGSQRRVCVLVRVTNLSLCWLVAPETAACIAVSLPGPAPAKVRPLPCVESTRPRNTNPNLSSGEEITGGSKVGEHSSDPDFQYMTGRT